VAKVCRVIDHDDRDVIAEPTPELFGRHEPPGQVRRVDAHVFVRKRSQPNNLVNVAEKPLAEGPQGLSRSLPQLFPRRPIPPLS